MSEYQYYEFLALDRTLNQTEIAELREISSRAKISSRRFCNVYNYGDLRGDPIERLIELKQAKPYQEAAQLLRDLYDLGQREKHQEAFQSKLQALRGQHAKKRSFWERVQKLGLGQV